MDIFYFYNGCKNIHSFINKEEDELTKQILLYSEILL